MTKQDIPKAIPRIEHPKDAKKPQPEAAPAEKVTSIAPRSSAPAETVEAPAPKPLTPKEKIKAITPIEEQASSRTGDKAAIMKLNLSLNQPGGCLPIDHRASKAPAKQELELRHGKSNSHSAQARLQNPSPADSVQIFNDEIFRM